MYDLVLNETKKELSVVINDIFSYWNIYGYLKYRFKNVLDNETVIFNNNSEFWYSILKTNFGGDNKTKFKGVQPFANIKIKNCFLSDWIPKMPGKIWTYEGQKKLHESITNIENNSPSLNRFFPKVLTPFGKERAIAAGYGTIRINSSLSRSKDFYSIMSLTSNDNWLCDYGIPIVVHKTVYEEYLKKSKQGAPQVDVEGILYYNFDLPLQVDIPKAIGANIPNGLQETLLLSPNLPKIFVYIPSPLNCKFKINDSHPSCTAWTCFTHGKKHLFPIYYTYAHFNPYNDQSIESAIDFINKYVKNYSGNGILTDFDGVMPRLKSKVTLESDPINNAESKVIFNELMKNISGYNKKINDRQI